MEQVTLDLYRVFLTVAEEGSFSAAARRAPVWARPLARRWM